MKRYSTHQRSLLLSFLSEHADCPMTVEQIAEALCGKQGISRSAVYRNLPLLVEEGFVRRFASEDGRACRYQFFDCGHRPEHLHLKCTVCGKLIHLDEAESSRIGSAVLLQNHFTLDEKQTILYGRCSSCNPT